MNEEFVSAKVIMLELLFGAVWTNHIKIIAWRKQVNYFSDSWYGVTCHFKDMGRWQSLL